MMTGEKKDATTRGDDPSAIYFQTPWVWYIHFQCASVNYGTSYQRIGDFNTMSEFWKLYNNIPDVGSVHDGTVRLEKQSVVAYSVFRHGVLPQWEDATNIAGSEWGCRESLNRAFFQTLWNDYLFAAIGELIPHCVGIRAINKSNKNRGLHKIEVWMDAKDSASTQMCRRSLTEIVPETPRFSLMFHQDKKQQALEFQKRRRKNPVLGRYSAVDDEEQ